MIFLNRRLILTLIILVGEIQLATVLVEAQVTNLAIVNVTDNRNDYSGGTIPRYEKFEITFEVVNSQATNFDYPYDSNPPPGITPKQGISVEAEFTAPDGEKYRQPAFYFQDFDYQIKSHWSGPKDWLYPTNKYAWKVRFAPNREGVWRYLLTAQDASGINQSTNQQFTVGPSTNKGFIRVSRNDNRYFEFDDGTYFPGLGYNMNYDHVNWRYPRQNNLSNFLIMGQNGIQLIRIWLSQWNIFGSEWNPWQSHTGNGYLQKKHLVLGQGYPDDNSEISLRLSATLTPSSSCTMNNWTAAEPAIKPITSYRLRIRYKAEGIASPIDPARPYGLAAKLGGWLWHDTDVTQRCNYPGVGTLITNHYNPPTNQWQILDETFTTPNSNFLDRLYIVIDNAQQGTVYIDRIWIEEDLGTGQYGANILQKPDMDHHTYFDQRNAFAFDLVLDLAKQNGVYLRPVLQEKNDWMFQRIQSDGNWDLSMTDEAQFNNDRFYGDWRNLTKSRWLQQAWWRYLQARWGYSPNIHSWELLNEGDPWNSRHYTLADELGKYMHCRVFGIEPGGGGAKCNYDHPNNHLVSTSTWHSFPKSQFWTNSEYPNVDFASIHRYIDKATEPNFYDAAKATFDLSQSVFTTTPYGASKPVIRGETGFTDSGSGPVTSDPGFIIDTRGQAIWLHNFIWGGLNPYGMLESYWYENVHIYTDSFDHRPHFDAFYNFIKDIPLTNGNYQDASSSATRQDLRVWGQKDTANGRAHLWIQNSSHTWKNVVDRVTISPITASITISGFVPNRSYPVVWWDTYAGQPTVSTNVTADASGILNLIVSNLTADTAVKIGNYAPPSRCLPSGDVDCNGKVNALDAVYVISKWGTADIQADLDDSGAVTASDLRLLLTNYLAQ